MAMRITRRRLLEAAGTAAVAGTLPGLSGAALAQEAESHGLSTFGELALPPDFPHFAYVNPKAPKALVFAGWKDMDAYMRENNIQGSPSVLGKVEKPERPEKPADIETETAEPASGRNRS